MDRREALRRMAATGATVAGATLVTSTTAFADGGTVNSQPTSTAGGTITFVANTVSGDKARRTLSIASNTTPTGSCPFGTPTTPRKEYAWSINTGTITGTTFTATLPTTVTATAPGAGQWNASPAFTARLTVRWVCDQAPDGTTAAWVCRSFNVVVEAFNSPGSSGTVRVISQGEDSTALNCDAPVPLPS